MNHAINLIAWFLYLKNKLITMGKLFNGLPLFEGKIDLMDDETGMFCISLVDEPATESLFLSFDKDKKTLQYKVENEEQHKVFGLVMEADKPIYRRDSSGYEYYIMYSKETIALMAEKYFKEGFHNNVDTMHNFEYEEGITLTQMFIKDIEKGVNPIGFEDIADGSLFAEFHIENTDVWSAIKDGTYRGFSLAGVFEIAEVEKFNKDNKKTNIFKMKVDKVKAMLRKLLAQFGEVATDKGTILWDGDEDLKEGDSVHGVDSEGNEVAIEDGEYTTEDKKVITIKDGKVESIVDVENPETEETETIEGAEEGAEETESTEEVIEESPNAEIEALRTEIAELRKLIEELTSRLEKVEGTPAAKSAEEEFASIKTDTNTKAGKMRQRGYRF